MLWRRQKIVNNKALYALLSFLDVEANFLAVLYVVEWGNKEWIENCGWNQQLSSCLFNILIWCMPLNILQDIYSLLSHLVDICYLWYCYLSSVVDICVFTVQNVFQFRSIKYYCYYCNLSYTFAVCVLWGMIMSLYFTTSMKNCTVHSILFVLDYINLTYNSGVVCSLKYVATWLLPPLQLLLQLLPI